LVKAALAEADFPDFPKEMFKVVLVKKSGALLQLKLSRIFHLSNFYLAPRRVNLFIYTACRCALLGAFSMRFRSMT
jgi:hypothetical protein